MHSMRKITIMKTGKYEVCVVFELLNTREKVSCLGEVAGGHRNQVAGRANCATPRLDFLVGFKF
jgi:hypothetical protein